MRYWHERTQDMFDVKCKNKHAHLNVILLNGMCLSISPKRTAELKQCNNMYQFTHANKVHI